MGGNIAKVAREDLEKKLEVSVITNENRLNYKYINDKEKIENM